MKVLCLIAFLWISTVAFGNADSINVRVTEVSNLSEDLSVESEFVQIDTILNQFYHYNFDGRDGVTSLGNPGLSYGSMFMPKIKYGFSSGETSFSRNFNETSNRKIYHTTDPFARVSYRSGPKKYQDFDVLFSQNITKNLNFSVSYNTQSSTGMYINQTTETRQFSFQNSYKANSGKYGYYLAFKVNSGYALENGGIKSDSLYSELTQLGPFDIDNNKLKLQVWLEDDSNYYDHRNLYYTQFVKLFSNNRDSIGQKELVFGLTNEGGYDDLWFTGKNSDSNYYARYGITIEDSSSVYDKSHLFYLKNSGFFKYWTGGNGLNFSLGVDYNYYENRNLNSQQDFYELGIYGKVNKLRFGAVDMNLIVKKGLEGFNEDGYFGRLDLKLLSQNDRLNVMLYGESISTLPEYKTLNYAGNYFGWQNDFNYVRTNTIGLRLVESKLKLELLGEVESIENYVYYDTDIQPKQYSTNFGRYFFQLKKNFVLKSFHFEISVINQKNDVKAPINLPDWIISATVYHQRFLFKDAMELRYGIDYWQNNSYYGSNYTPFNRSFSYQNNKLVGGFPYFNFYISARIKSAQGFVNIQNVGQILIRDSYMMVPDYALQDFGISFGLRWDFYN